ncbi:BtrH N-terminal domain-containing protein [Bacillus sp. YC2]|uniref:BtrH N-terminal domain-containing protein n=1 Tax=Bacillus sp. YC2 TaxID=2861287 RepID=UPI001CA63D2C|nr:BtrH N-terminal domain-containing protein [Bacillus sp. YC2]MBY8914135.1 BtrH N-terminal domain-containing protein [Bacillus sp. YC2]
MTCEHRIFGIAPFNELFYQSCFYNCYFAAVRSFNKELYPYLLNDIYSYQTDDDGYLSVRCTSVHDPEKLMNLQGISAEKQPVSEDIIEDIKKDIDRQKPIIIWLDTFSQPYRPEYMTKHYRNCLLVFGYDETDRTAAVLENRHFDNLSYEVKHISFHHLTRAYKGFYRFFTPPQSFHSYASFSYEAERDRTGSCMFTDADSYFALHVNQHRDELFSGLESSRNFTEQFSSLGDTEKMLQAFNRIIHAKRVEQYRLSYLSMRADFADLLADIIEEWETARHQTAKLFFSGQSDPEYQSRIIQSLKRITELETVHCERLADYCAKERIR